MIIPGDNLILKQNNRSSLLGNIVSSFNLDLTSNLGRVRTTRTKLVSTGATVTDLELPIAFAFYSGSFFALTDDFVFEGGSAPGATFTKVNDDLGSAESTSDMVAWNNALYASDADGDIQKYTGTTWSVVGSTVNSLSPHLLEPYADRLYMTYDFTKVYSLSDSDSIATSGLYTLDLGINPNEFSISMLEAGTNGLWIGVLNHKGGRGMVYFWNGETENTPQAIYYLDTPGVIAGTVAKDENVPYIVDSDGKLLKFNGAGFEEIARFPLNGAKLEGADSASNLRFIHPNGIVEKDNKILILINNQIADNATPADRSTPPNLPSGVWEYSVDTGLYHKYSVSYSSVNDSGTTNLSDYGQNNLTQVGALSLAFTADNTSSNDGVLLLGAGYYDTPGGEQFGIFTNNQLDDTKKLGYFVTTDITSENIQETWNEVYTKHKRLLNSADKITLKYRTVDEDNDTEIAINWVDTNSFTTLESVSDYEVGDEVEITRGTGSGFSAHIIAIETNEITTQITIDTVVTGATGSGRARFQKWKYAGVTTGENKNQYALFNVGVTDVKLSLKVVMEWTGKNELYELVVNSSKSI